MNETPKQIPYSLDLKVGDRVEVRQPAEILSTLDEKGTLEGLPFMPEMLRYSGQQYWVYKRAHKACDTIGWSGLRKMENAVHLELLRCDGQGHGGCQAGCLLFWKEAWLKRVKQPDYSPASPPTEEELRGAEALLLKYTTRQEQERRESHDVRYSCQATEILRATAPLPWWDLRQFWQDWSCGNVPLKKLVRSFVISVFNKMQRLRRGVQYPYIEGCLSKTPSEHLGLKSGDLVRVKPKIEITKTLDRRNRNRGLSFDREMVKYCGGTYRVLRRVERIINDRTGMMMRMPNDCIVLEGVICQGDLNKFCPRAILPYWRETWLARVPSDSQPKAPDILPVWREIWLDVIARASRKKASK